MEGDDAKGAPFSRFLEVCFGVVPTPGLGFVGLGRRWYYEGGS